MHGSSRRKQLHLTVERGPGSDVEVQTLDQGWEGVEAGSPGQALRLCSE